jgi:hypothetical protein
MPASGTRSGRFLLFPNENRPPRWYRGWYLKCLLKRKSRRLSNRNSQGQSGRISKRQCQGHSEGQCGGHWQRLFEGLCRGLCRGNWEGRSKRQWEGKWNGQWDGLWKGLPEEHSRLDSPRHARRHARFHPPCTAKCTPLAPISRTQRPEAPAKSPNPDACTTRRSRARRATKHDGCPRFRRQPRRMDCIPTRSRRPFWQTSARPPPACRSRYRTRRCDLSRPAGSTSGCGSPASARRSQAWLRACPRCRRVRPDHQDWVRPRLSTEPLDAP